MRRPGQPIDIANATLFLASDESSLINGATVTADAGWSERALSVSINREQVLDIAAARLLDLYNVRLAARGIERATEDEVDAVVFGVLGELDDYLRGLAREKRLPGREIKPIAQARVEERLAEAGA